MEDQTLSVESPAGRVQHMPPGLTLSERLELFRQGRTYRRIKPYIGMRYGLAVLFALWVAYSLTDYELISDGEPYTQKTRCVYPLVLFKDSAVRSHKDVARVDVKSPDFAQLNDVLTTSACYLREYAGNMSCVTPLAYGYDLTVISMRHANGTVLHLINPIQKATSDKYVLVPETSTLLPGSAPVKVRRPLFVTVEYLDTDLRTVRFARLERADAFCVSSSMDLFARVLPQRE